MDNRISKFVNAYLVSVAAPVAVPEPMPAARPGMGARVMQGLTGAAGRLGEAASAVRSGIRSITEVPANVRALTEPRVVDEIYHGVQEPVTQTQVARVRYDANTRKITGANTPEEIQQLKQEGFTDRQIQQARNLAMRTHYEAIRNAKAAKRKETGQRIVDQGRAMFTKGLSGSHLQGRLAAMTPAGKAGMVVMTGLSVWYYLFSGKKPNANTEDGQAVLMDVPPATEMVSNIITKIDEVIKIANQSNPDVVTVLSATKTALNALKNSSLTIDDKASSQAFVQTVKNAETAINSALSQLESFTPTEESDLQKVQELQVLFSDFVINIVDVRGMQA